MQPPPLFRNLLIISSLLTFSACGVPHYDVPTDSAGQPTVKSIIDRITCEIRDMVRDDMGRNDVTSFHRLFLLNGDYDVAVNLSLDVNDSGGLTPSLSFINPLQDAASLTFGISGTLSQSRVHNFSENVQFSVREIYNDWKKNLDPHDCPQADTNLAGDLGLRNIVAMAALTPYLNEKQKSTGTDDDEKPGGDKQKSSVKGVFGGSVQFVVTKNITGGPTWSLVNFRGPGSLASLSEIHTNKITLSFAKHPKDERLRGPGGRNEEAFQFLQQLITSGISTQINLLQSGVR